MNNKTSSPSAKEEYPEGRKKLIPKLRFLEFQDAGVWDVGKLGEKCVSLFVKERTPLGQLTLESYVSTENLLPNYSGVTLASKLPPAGSFTRFEKGDILVSNIRPYLKKVWFANKNGSASNDVIVIRSQSRVRNSFLIFVVKNDEFISYVMKGAKGVKMPRGDISLIKEYPITFPKKKEQKKIADCLSSLDDLITAHSEKHAALKVHKKGLMQQLFPAEGETVPKLRFPKFREVWNSIDFGKCFDTIGGTALEKHAIDAGTHHFISIGNYSTDGKYIDKGQRIEVNNTTKPKLLNKNDLVMVLNDKTLAGDIIGSTLLIDEDNKYIYNQRSERLIVGSELTPIFSWHLLNSQVFRKEVYKMSQGGTQIYVNFPSIKAIKLAIPKHTKEQQKIADCLSSIDDLVTTQAQKIESLKAHKKGLMQQLFPAVDEVT